MRGVPSGTEINVPDISIVDSILVLRKLKDAGKLLHQQYTDFTHMLPNAVYSSYCKSGHHNPIFLWGKFQWDPLQVNLEHQLEEWPLQIRKIFSWEHSSLKASQSMSWEYSSKLQLFSITILSSSSYESMSKVERFETNHRVSGQSVLFQTQ